MVVGLLINSENYWWKLCLLQDYIITSAVQMILVSFSSSLVTHMFHTYPTSSFKNEFTTLKKE